MDEDGNLIIHSKSIGIHLHHAMICTGIGVDPEKCFLVQNPTGATFGYKFSPTMESMLGVACLATGRPVSLVYDQYQQITYTGKRSPAFMKIKLGADENGKILALEGENYIDHGPYSEFGDLLTMRLTQFVGAGYGIPNIRNTSYTVCTNHAWGSAFRGYGAPQSFMGTDTAIDVLAAQMGMDPFELRYINAYRPGDTTPTGQTPEVYSIVPMMDKLRPLYEEAKVRVKENSTDKVKRGVGISIGVYGCGLDGADSSEAYAEITPKGVTIYNSWEDHGQGADIGTLTMAHATLKKAGYKPEDISLVMCDMRQTPNSGPAGGSRSNVVTGNATRIAAENLLKGLEKADGTYRTYDEMVAEGLPTKYVGKWVASMCTDCQYEDGQGAPFSNYMYVVNMPEVAVDMETGKAKVEKFTCMVDCGKIINKLVVDGQVYGALAQGIGLALTEDFEDLNKHTTLVKCGIPQIEDIPDDLEIHYEEALRPDGPYGASGVGEGPLAAPHPAILNAIYNATGARITRVPATPDVVKAALDELASGANA
jgi:aldehyde oxidoreductase